MPAIWFAIKRSLDCKSLSDVHDPKTSSSSSSSTRMTRNLCRSGCSRSIVNLKGVIHGSKTSVEKPQMVIGSPRSLVSNEFSNPITHEVVLKESKCELKITKFCYKGGCGSPFVGTLRPGTPGPDCCHIPRNPATPSRKVLGESPIFSSGNVGASSNPRGSSTSVCQKCGKNFKNFDAVEAHHLSKHAVTELVEGEFSRKIVEMICRIENNSGHMERVFKVHNIQKRLAEFEEYRETVKIKANKLSKKYPRCLADGNELLRFYGTTVTCSLGLNGCSSLCSMEKCGLCQILRDGFSIQKESIGVFTTSTSETSIAYIDQLNEIINQSVRCALIVCRVIAGRIHRPSENFQKITGQSGGFDSLVGKVDRHYNVEELYSLNPKALLPCFVVIC
ncbi:hypothetical protein Ddye_019459 [Dipteronia dyeriana]|uniref:C2H2-type domain-containing protein n=1 Tax=Dipteronia dyeriana TaxID=168575 RepID=A0AAD9WUG0_9ROSI|nr:hypothetical protein Ddye_019459 [Dipteronia dyeriana]